MTNCFHSILLQAEQQTKLQLFLKFIYSEKATKFCNIFPLLLTVCTVVKSKGKILQNFVAFSKYMNFNNKFWVQKPIKRKRIKIPTWKCLRMGTNSFFFCKITRLAFAGSPDSSSLNSSSRVYLSSRSWSSASSSSAGSPSVKISSLGWKWSKNKKKC